LSYSPTCNIQFSKKARQRQAPAHFRLAERSPRCRWAGIAP